MASKLAEFSARRGPFAGMIRMPDPNTLTDKTSAAKSAQASPLGTFRSPVHDSRLKVLFSNLRDFLVERPVKVRGGASDVFATAGFGASISENLSEFFKSAPKGATNSDLMDKSKMGFTGFWQNLKDLISPPPPIKTSSQPVAVKDIWSKDTQFTRVQAVSIAFHVVALVLIIAPFLPGIISPQTTKAAKPMDNTDLISPYMPKVSAPKKAGGGGGARDLQPASRGKAPKFDKQQFTPPLSHPVANPKVAMTPTLLGNPNITPPNINAPNWGDPLSHVLGDSMGNGKGTGIGNGDGGGLGNGFNSGTGGGYPSAGTGGYGTPACLYCPQAQFSDEAVKAKYSGTVLVSFVVLADGRTTNVRVIKGLGLGLDENAVTAVKSWRFRPALGPDQKPTSVQMQVEVVFHLY